jgi:hypothetical protein
MSQYYFETLKKALSEPNFTKEGLQAIIDESHFFFGVLRVKVESKDAALREQAVRELGELKSLLEERLAKSHSL